MRPDNKLSVVEESQFGVYVWVVDGKILSDEEYRPLSIDARKGDLKRIEQLRQAATHYGYPNGIATFMSGHRKVTDEEYEHQKFRQTMGLTPDEYDIPALIEEMNNKKRQGR